MMVPVNVNDCGAGAGVTPHNYNMGQQSAPPTGDLLGLGASSPPQRPQQHHVINANQATVSITTSAGAGAAPSIAGLGKIAPSAQTQGSLPNSTRRKAVVVPVYSCSGGFDTKFNHFARHARPSDLHNLLSPEEYEREIRTLNDKIKTARPKAVDMALLATAPLLIVPLPVWGIRHGQQAKKKRRLIEEGVMEFNERMGMDGRNVRMVWNRAKVVGGGESYLTIEEREAEDGTGRKKFD